MITFAIVLNACTLQIHRYIMKVQGNVTVMLLYPASQHTVNTEAGIGFLLLFLIKGGCLRPHS